MSMIMQHSFKKCTISWKQSVLVQTMSIHSNFWLIIAIQSRWIALGLKLIEKDVGNTSKADYFVHQFALAFRVEKFVLWKRSHRLFLLVSVQKAKVDLHLALLLSCTIVKTLLHIWSKRDPGSVRPSWNAQLYWIWNLDHARSLGSLVIVLHPVTSAINSNAKILKCNSEFPEKIWDAEILRCRSV